MRTAKASVFFRATFVVFVIYMGLGWLWNWMTETAFWTTLEMAISAVLTVVVFGGFAWLVTNLGMGLLFGRSMDYRRYRESGGDPFFDSLLCPFDPNSASVVDGPHTSFTPPPSWKFECPVCAARQPSRICVCWNCNYGADGDSTAYFERFGDVKPGDMTEEQWSSMSLRVRSKDHTSPNRASEKPK